MLRLNQAEILGDGASSMEGFFLKEVEQKGRCVVISKEIKTYFTGCEQTMGGRFDTIHVGHDWQQTNSYWLWVTKEALLTKKNKP